MAMLGVNVLGGADSFPAAGAKKNGGGREDYQQVAKDLVKVLKKSKSCMDAEQRQETGDRRQADGAPSATPLQQSCNRADGAPSATLVSP